ncbi:MAG TPA: hypothetical protein PK629_11870 [Oscillospiraceae bacterium]|nr:hypothetical protein [Oscillospiraceae bacterium]HPF55121.1 hypothetical protein [Clostridiales bacterium]HPK34561.1 hypothetical protein [Oscillospiraceae bacterium]HPR74789.1 hypothetical protein [Oscillospiraceae bacterium]
MERVQKIDIHVHQVLEKGMPRFTGDTFTTPEELLIFYKLLGVEKGVVLPGVSPEGTFDCHDNKESYQIVRKYPQYFYWFCNLDPRMGNNSPDTDFSHFLNYYKGLGAKGVGELTANMYFDDPMVLNLFKHCEACDMPVTFHIGFKGNDYGLIDDLGLPRLEKVLNMFPKLKFLGHSQKFWSEISGDVTEQNRGENKPGKVTPGGRVVELMRKYPNLCGDLSASSGYNAVSRDPEFGYAFMEEFQDRLYYGTDICSPVNITWDMLKLSAFLDEAMEKGKISYAAYKKISRTNALALLER